ncbi:hypothetical protein M422DRAFT_167702 [Sphaerobolus stellatus SS14]|uniref:Protein-S-isoprenylcysteine O-methyltransferase n=1 Tax=Sphaerobolus stellatus (strain SS14) TaxID=990650 RepID=A0A0C9UP13_SPHS4|nr:hypothetical protein M422DRAFT_167702 [Sphaerobolus stellatus SS14]
MEILALLSSQFTNFQIGRSVLSKTCPTGAKEELSKFTPSLIVGVTAIVVGGSLRILCFRTLGRFFTFQITIRSDHKIVDIGPYGIVRHPSYVGSFLVITGATVFAAGPGSYPWVCGLDSSSAFLGPSLGAWIAFLAYWLYSILSRGPIEDRVLHAELGKEWEEYAKRVPYMFIPGVI